MMKIFFEFDTEELNGNRYEKLKELKEIEKVLIEEIKNIEESSEKKKISDYYKWFVSLPDKSF